MAKKKKIPCIATIAIRDLCLNCWIGVIGYHYLAEASWIDAFHNASMILSGMGPVITIASETGKIFSSFYALFSGLVFVTNVGVLLAPVMHRIMHRIHLEA
jgi:hypothetical protein